jgi:hypothetical protein
MDEVDGEMDIGEVEFFKDNFKVLLSFRRRRNHTYKLDKDWRF